MVELDFEALTEATSGAVGGLLSTTILYPLDTCKTKYQAEARKAGEQSKYRNLLDVLREAVASRKILSLYQGIHTKNFQSVLAGFVYFYGYSYFKRLYLSYSGAKRMGMGANLLVAAAAGVCTATLSQPFDTLSARMQTSGPGKAEGFLALIREQGLRHAFDGLGASLLLVSNPTIQYTVFEQLKERLLRLQRKEQAMAASATGAIAGPIALTAFTAFLLGALSKTVATVVTYPAIRCKVMMQRAETDEEKESRRAGGTAGGPPRSMLEALRIIWHMEGFFGLYKGLHAQVLKTVLSAALMLMIKEKVSEGTRATMLALKRSLAANLQQSEGGAAAAVAEGAAKSLARLGAAAARPPATEGAAMSGPMLSSAVRPSQRPVVFAGPQPHSPQAEIAAAS